MRYRTRRMSLDNTMPSSVFSWLGHELESRGIDAVIYTRYILSILQQDSMESDHVDVLEGKMDVKPKGKGSKKGKPKKAGSSANNSEERKKTAAVECLLSVTDEDSGIEDLVEELCVKLKQVKDKQGRKDNSSESQVRSRATVGKTPEDPAEKYYAAFPALPDQDNQPGIPSPVHTSENVWSKKTQPHTNDDADSDKSSKLQVEERPRKDVTTAAKNRKGKKVEVVMAASKHLVKSVTKPVRNSKEDMRSKAPVERKRYGPLKSRSAEGCKSSPHTTEKRHSPFLHRKTKEIAESVKPSFIVPKVPVTSRSPVRITTPTDQEDTLRNLLESVERKLSERRLAKINEPSAFSHFSNQQYPKRRHNSDSVTEMKDGENTEKTEDTVWYTEPIDRLYCNSPAPSERLYLRRQSCDDDDDDDDIKLSAVKSDENNDVVSANPEINNDEELDNLIENIIHDCSDDVKKETLKESSPDSTVLVSGILQRYLSSGDEDEFDNNAVKFDIDFPVRESDIGAPLLYNGGVFSDLSNQALNSSNLVESCIRESLDFEQPFPTDGAINLIDKNENEQEDYKGVATLSLFTEFFDKSGFNQVHYLTEKHEDITDESKSNINSHTSRFMQMFDNNENLAMKDKEMDKVSEDCMEDTINKTNELSINCSQEGGGELFYWPSIPNEAYLSEDIWLCHNDLNFYNPLFYGLNNICLYSMPFNYSEILRSPKTQYSHPFEWWGEPQHLWDVNFSASRPSMFIEPPSLDTSSIFGTSPPCPQGLLKICDNLDVPILNWCDHLSTNFLPDSLTKFIPEWRSDENTVYSQLPNNSQEDVFVSSQRTRLVHQTGSMKTSTSTDSFFIRPSLPFNKTCKIKLLYRQRSRSFGDGLYCADSLSNVYVSPRSKTYVEALQTQAPAQDDLLFSPQTHFRPIQTPSSSSPEEGSSYSKREIVSPIPEGYQVFEHDNDNVCAFVPKFRVQQGTEKYAQTEDGSDSSSPNTVETKHEGLATPPRESDVSPGWNLLGYFSETGSESESQLQFQFDFAGGEEKDSSMSESENFAETLTQNTISKLLEDTPRKAYIEECSERTPSLSKSKFAKMFEKSVEKLDTTSSYDNLLVTCANDATSIPKLWSDGNLSAYSKHSLHHPNGSKLVPWSTNADMKLNEAEMVNSNTSLSDTSSVWPKSESSTDGHWFTESPDTSIYGQASETAQIKQSQTLSHTSISSLWDISRDAALQTVPQSNEVSNPSISKLWDAAEETSNASDPHVSPLPGLERHSSIWSMSSESEASGSVWGFDYLSAGTDDAQADLRDMCEFVTTEAEGYHEDSLANSTKQEESLEAPRMIFSSELEEQWLASEDNFAVQAPRKTSSTSAWKHKKPCSFFMVGHCRKTDCRYAHDISHVTCRYWEEGSCFKGVTCPFLHGYSSDTPLHQIVDASSAVGLSHSTKNFLTKATSPRSRKCRSSPRRMQQPSYLIRHRSAGTRRRLFKSNLDNQTKAGHT